MCVDGSLQPTILEFCQNDKLVRRSPGLLQLSGRLPAFACRSSEVQSLAFPGAVGEIVDLV